MTLEEFDTQFFKKGMKVVFTPPKCLKKEAVLTAAVTKVYFNDDCGGGVCIANSRGTEFIHYSRIIDLVP